MGYIVPCVPGNHQADADDPGVVFKSMIDPRYPPEVGQMMNVYSCAEHSGQLAAHCGVWMPHDGHGFCSGTPDGDNF